MRSYLISILSSSPSLLTPTLRLLSKLANSRSPLLNPDRNILLWYLLKKTFYVQFCAGETAKEVRNTTDGLKKMGYQGVILGYGKEIVANNKASVVKENEMDDIDDQATMKAWKQGNLETVRLAEKGDFVALKYGLYAHAKVLDAHSCSSLAECIF